jgi:hypothetical protein
MACEEPVSEAKAAIGNGGGHGVIVEVASGGEEVAGLGVAAGGETANRRATLRRFRVARRLQ